MARDLKKVDFGVSSFIYFNLPDRLLEQSIGGSTGSKTVSPEHTILTESANKYAVRSFNYKFDTQIPQILDLNRNDELHFEFGRVSGNFFRGMIQVTDFVIRVRGPQLRTRRNLGAGPVRFSRLG
ncbi:MAG: hypothetical protein VX951_08865 [Planctomycetota bacterium]|nr:hypothetical protein [Planctomycetota bacterium]